MVRRAMVPRDRRVSAQSQRRPTKSCAPQTGQGMQTCRNRRGLSVMRRPGLARMGAGRAGNQAANGRFRANRAARASPGRVLAVRYPAVIVWAVGSAGFLQIQVILRAALGPAVPKIEYVRTVRIMFDVKGVFDWAKENGEVKAVDRILIKVMLLLIKNKITLTAATIDRMETGVVLPEELSEAIVRAAEEVVGKPVPDTLLAREESNV